MPPSERRTGDPVDKDFLPERIGVLPPNLMEQIEKGLRLVLHLQ